MAVTADVTIVGGAVAVVAGAIYGAAYAGGDVDYLPGVRVVP